MRIVTNPNLRERADDPVTDLVLRCACEAAQGWLQATEASRRFMEAESGQTGWRAFASPETLAAVEHLERTGGIQWVDADLP